MTTVRIIMVRYRILSRRNKAEYVLCCLKLVPPRGKNIHEPRLLKEILVPLKGVGKFPMSTPVISI